MPQPEHAMAKTTTGDWRTGYVHVYTGDGKGKTTAALGLALRAAGAGLKVFIAQFAKGTRYSELETVKRLSDCIELCQFGRGRFIRGKPTQEDIQAARQGLEAVRRVFAEGRHRLVILDEANIATHFGLFAVDELLELIDAKPGNVELVITGRRADPRVMARADLVTEMRQIKHYYTKGIPARRGIEN
jgi:cob(I)alamin adenosyltransferase